MMTVRLNITQNKETNFQEVMWKYLTMVVALKKVLKNRNKKFKTNLTIIIDLYECVFNLDIINIS